MTATFRFGKATLYRDNCLEWLGKQRANSFHGVVTDPPFGLVEYSREEQSKLRSGSGGTWRLPPAFDGYKRSPLPRFTTLRDDELANLKEFYIEWATLLRPAVVPGGHVIIAAHPLLSSIVSDSLHAAGFERRGAIVRLAQTMRGGDRPKNAHVEFRDVSVMPRSMWEPWLLFRKPLEGRVQDNLRKWKAGGLRRPSADRPFGDVIRSRPTLPLERALAPHPSLKPQSFLRQIVHAVLPLGVGTVLDPFAGSGSTLAAAQALGLRSVGVELVPEYFRMARKAIPRLAALKLNGEYHTIRREKNPPIYLPT